MRALGSKKKLVLRSHKNAFAMIASSKEPAGLRHEYYLPIESSEMPETRGSVAGEYQLRWLEYRNLDKHVLLHEHFVVLEFF